MDLKSNTAFYLKYRPQTLNDLFGQEEVKKNLLGAYSENRLSHAYLFVGPRGTGKTSTARILAKMINCEASGKEEKNEVPCNKCQICLSITDGSNLDLIEIDAASNRGIEDIRSLREKIKLSPTLAKKKIYIIDEVHMLTTEAFNALLKTLEEPPSHAIFILATTEAGKLPQTILSRVQRLNFKLASFSELWEALGKIVKDEKIDIEQEALKLLVKKADGSFRDGVKLLDQVSSAGGKITQVSLQASLKFSNSEMIIKLLETLSKKDTTSGLTLILNQLEKGVDCKEVILSLMDSFRNLVFIKYGLGETIVKSQMLEEKYQELEKLAQGFDIKDLTRNLDILQASMEKLKFASILSLPLELAIVEMCSERISAVGQLATDSTNIMELQTITMENPIPEVVSSSIPLGSEGLDDIARIKEKWTFVLETIRQSNFSLEALLRSINITSCTKTTLIMEVPYSFHQRILETPKNRDLLESILSEILGRGIRISTILGSRPQRREDIANIEVAADDEIIKAAAEIFNSETIN